MKKLFLSLFLIPILAFSLEFNISKEFSSKVEPTILSSQIYITTKDKEKEEVIKRLELIKEVFTSNLDITKRNSSLSVHPYYTKNEDGSKEKGYNGSLFYFIRSTDEEVIKGFLNKLFLSNKDNKIDITISGMEWEIDEKDKEKVVNDLNKTALDWAKDFILNSKVSKEINKEIYKGVFDNDLTEISYIYFIDNIKIDDPYFSNIYPRGYMKARSEINSVKEEKEEINFPTVEKTDKEIKIRAHYSFRF